MRVAIWTVRFITEVLALLGIAWGAFVSLGGAVGLIVAAVGMGAAGIAWGLWVAPASHRRLRDPVRFLLECGILGTGALGFAAAFSVSGGIAFGALALGVAGLMRVPALAEPLPNRRF